MHAWFTVVGFSVIAWGFLALGSSGKFPSAVETTLAVLAVASTLIAGYAALNTWVYRFVGWIVGLHPTVSLAVMGIVLIAIGATIPVLIWNQQKWTPPLVGAWVVLPSTLSQGVVSGEFGGWMTKVVLEIGRSLSAQTTGWF